MSHKEQFSSTFHFTHFQELVWTWGNSARGSKRAMQWQSYAEQDHRAPIPSPWGRKRVWYSLSFTTVREKGEDYEPKKGHIFPPSAPVKTSFDCLQTLARERSHYITKTLSSYPPKAGRCPQQHTRKYLPGEQQPSPGTAQPTSTHHSPDDGYELCHGQLFGNQKLGFVQERKVFLFMVSLNNYLF